MARVRRVAAAAREESGVREAPGAGARVLHGAVQTVPVGAIEPHPENARRGNVAAIKRSIAENGFYGRVLVWREKNLIVVGSHRWRAAVELGMRQIPAEFVSLTERQARRILAADNRSSDLAGYSDESLALLLQRLRDDGDLDAANYSEEDLSDVLRRIEPPTAPDDFKNLDPGGMHLARKCPKCGFEF